MYRTQKYASKIKKVLAPMLMDIAKPHGVAVTIIDISLSSDLKNATINISLYGRSTEAVFELIESQRSGLARDLAHSSKSKFTPRLEFKIDDRLQQADRINQLLQK